MGGFRCAVALLLLCTTLVDVAGRATAAETPFGFSAVLEKARTLARQAFTPPPPVPEFWQRVGLDQHRAIGFDRGVHHAADAINQAGGVKGRKIELIVRDTQGDPTKAVNAVQEMISRAKVHAIWGPTNSGEALATTPIMARAKLPNIHPCVVDSLIDPQKYPNAYRIAPSNGQWDDAVRAYCLNILTLKDVAVVGDTTGYGTTAVGASVAAFKKDGADVVYQANIDATQPDMTPDMLRARNAGAEVIVRPFEGFVRTREFARSQVKTPWTLMLDADEVLDPQLRDRLHAAAVKATRLLLLTDVAGVLDADKKLIAELTAARARQLIAEGVINGGMIPKIETCLDAIDGGVEAAVIVDGRVRHAILLELFTEGAGTLIRAG